MAFSTVLYIARSAIRAENNDALIEAIQSANSFNLPLCVLIFLPEHLSARKLAFLLEGVREMIDGCVERDCSVALFSSSQVVPVLNFYTDKAAEVFLDSSYLPEELGFDTAVFSRFGPRARVISTSTIVPPQRIVNTQTYTAFLPRANAVLSTYLSLSEDPSEGLSFVNSKKMAPFPPIEKLDPTDHTLIPRFALDVGVPPANGWQGGLSSARVRLHYFLEELAHYPDALATPNSGKTSRLSPWLAEGQISPSEVVLAAQTYVAQLSEPARSEAAVGLKKFIESVYVFRELQFNFLYHNQEHYRRMLNLPYNAAIYDVGTALLQALPEWSRETLIDHAGDSRPLETNPALVEAGRTPDDVWNMTHRLFMSSGFLSPCLRTYWARKMLEFFSTPEEALGMCWRLNNRYCLDGGPTAMSSMLSAFGLFFNPDRTERPIYGVCHTADEALDSNVGIEKRRKRSISQLESGKFPRKFDPIKFVHETELAIEENFIGVHTDDCAGIGLEHMVSRRGEHGILEDEDANEVLHLPGSPRQRFMDTSRLRSLSHLEQP
ncbi:hypothetical protein P9112_012612 [Eukaryota sp. TZLM1-RC]